MTTIDRVRKVIDTAVGSDRLANVKETDQLVQGGIISSLEIVMIGLGLEQEFRLTIPDSQLTVANFATLETLAALMDRLSGKGDGAVQVVQESGFYRSMQESLAACIRRPMILAALVIVWLVALDRVLVPYVVERGPLASMYWPFADSGRRLYHSSGGWSPNDLRVGVGRHEFFRASSSTKPSILFFGDSGTIGSWVKAGDAPPARVEAKLKETLPDARVYNFAFFMRSFVKDVMLLEAILESTGERPRVDAAIFTFSDAYFDASFQKHLIDSLPYFSLNRDLLTSFRKRIKPKEAGPYRNLYKYLAGASRKFRGPFEEYVLENTSIYRYKTFFTFLSMHGKDTKSYWNKEYAIGNTPLFPVRLPSPPPTFQLHDAGFSKESVDQDLIALTDDVLDFLASKNIKIYIFLRPYAPLEWKGHPFPASPMNIETLIHERGWDKKATIIDLRWSLYGNQFSDSLSHYTPEGSQILGDAMGDAIASTLKRPSTSAVGSP